MKKLTHRNWNKWSTEEVQFLKDNYNKLTYQEIANHLRRTYDSIGRKAQKLRLDGRDLWSDEEDAILKNGYSCNPKIWELLPNRSRATIIVRARKLGVVRQCGNYGIDYKFFEKWSPEVAYVVGFFLADGCVEPHLNRISIELSMNDYDHLMNIKKLMKCENPICLKKTRNSCALYIHNKKMVQDIMSKGVLPNKTTRTRIPDVPEEYMRDFIRGNFDGDGSIWVKTINNANIQFLGSFKFIKDLHTYLYNKLNINTNILEHNKATVTKNCYRIVYSKSKDVNILLSYIFYEGCFCLKRKMELARGVIPRIIKPTQISQVNGSSIEEPERKTSSDTRIACRDYTWVSHPSNEMVV